MNVTKRELALTQFIIGVGFVVLGDRLNSLDVVDWGTVFLSTMGAILIVLSIINLLKKK